ncbi:allantoicase isoform X2 [Betta splendens]|uniref:Allantoate amidinohydrolase n=1 Tax=Betta splendens TaxID=158456 RepID=A0A6P7LSA4_BETSP|nr:allantoicase isoform X2 [Betta splendens]
MAAEPDFLQLNDLACESVGGKVIFATDEWFAPAANLLKRPAPQFIASAFTEFGKWMDGWETRRKRTAGHDWCIIELGVPGQIYGIDLDTSFFTGNHAPFASIQAACLEHPPAFTLEGDRTGMAASDAQLAAITKLVSEAWPELVGVSQLSPGYSNCCHNHFKVNFQQRVTHLRLNMYPDGGLARLRVYGVGQRDWSSVPPTQDVDLVALTNGGVCLGYSDAHFGHPRNMIGPGRADNMADGWETARRLDRPQILEVDQRGILQVPGWEWAVFRLGHHGIISSVEVDTNHFKGNFPDSCRIEACTLTPEEEAQCIRTKWISGNWQLLLPPQKLRPHHRHHYSQTVLALSRPVSHVRVIIAPDGGISRLRLWGRPTAAPTQQNRPASKL